MATAPFDFLPRIVSQHAKPWQGISSFPLPPSPDPTTDSGPEEDEDEDDLGTELDKGKGKDKAVEPAHSKQSILAQDIASLISLSLSDYNIWLDPDLRRKLDACLNDDTSPDGAGCTSPFHIVVFLIEVTPCVLYSQSYLSTTSFAEPPFVARSHSSAVVPPNRLKRRWSKPSARTRVMPSRFGCASLPLRPYGTARARRRARKMSARTKYGEKTGHRCEIAPRTGGRTPDGAG